ncbi:hypothetical protein AVEN_228109-1 [Araneus ventricosus]|uniref:Uncharacterized protein n=1 Tax=Araneus ventricosus TaxID=182803 RepID=A0A4Y2HR89_ARAVE|nr:hypothetical protein AVEN_228109-1 [Araneus ventricosus]
MMTAFSNSQIFSNATKFLSRHIEWRKSGHFEDPDTSPDMSLKSGRMVTLHNTVDTTFKVRNSRACAVAQGLLRGSFPTKDKSGERENCAEGTEQFPRQISDDNAIEP